MKEERSAHRGAHKAAGLAEGSEPSKGAGCWNRALLGLMTVREVDRRSLTHTGVLVPRPLLQHKLNCRRHPLSALYIWMHSGSNAAKQKCKLVSVRNVSQQRLYVASTSTAPPFSSPCLFSPLLSPFFHFSQPR